MRLRAGWIVLRNQQSQELDLVASHDLGALMRIVGCDREDLSDMLGELRELDPRPGRSLQRVVLFDSAGVPHALEYEMIETASGWKINGVRFLQAEAGA